MYLSLTLYSSWRYNNKIFGFFAEILLFALIHESSSQDDALRSALKSWDGAGTGVAHLNCLSSLEHPPEGHIYGKYSLLMASLQEILNGSDVEYLESYLS